MVQQYLKRLQEDYVSEELKKKSLKLPEGMTSAKVLGVSELLPSLPPLHSFYKTSTIVHVIVENFWHWKMVSHLL